jgi:signal peptidase II
MKIKLNKQKIIWLLSAYVLIFVAARIDLATKTIAFKFVDANTQSQQDNALNGVEITRFFAIVKAKNYGVSFSLFNNIKNGHIILSTVAITITLVVFIALHLSKTKPMLIATSLIVAGSIGNIYDRITIGAVRDFLYFHINDYYWPAFNFADSVIFIGVAILIISDIIKPKKI